MELVLNLLWFVLAAGALIAYLRTKAIKSDRFRLGLGALLCVSALLLPAISVTDDLHFDAFAVEDSNTTKRLTNAAVHASPASPVVWFGILLLALLFATPRCSVWRKVVAFAGPGPDSPFSRAVFGRAPPLSLV